MAKFGTKEDAKKQMAAMGLTAPYIGSEETRTEEEIKADRKTLAENVPILGEAILAKEIAEGVKDENYLSAGLNTAALAVGVIPGVGKVASKPIRAIAKSMRKDVKVKPTSVAGPYYDAPNYGDYHNRAAKVDQKKGKEKLKKLEGKNADFDLIQETLSESRIGNTKGQTAQADKVSFDPVEIKNIKGLMGEELYRSGDYTPPGKGSKLELLKKSIKEKGYKPDPITIVVREDGTPFIAEGNHRLAEALESGRPKIDANIQYLRNAEKVDGPLNPKRLLDPKTDIDLLVRATSETKKPVNKINKVVTKSTRKGYNPEDPASRVFHLTKTDFDAADVVGKGTNDIGFHVGTAAQANARGSTGIKYDKELAEKMVEKERVLPMVLKQTLKPARIIDVGSFKEPKNWISNLSVAKKDKQLINFLLGDSADADLLAKAPRVTVGGDTYFMLPDVMRSGVDENLWKDIILEAHRARRLGLDTINKQSDRVEWFNTLKQTANKNGYDSFVYKNEYEGAKELSKSASKGDSYMLLEPDQAKGLFGGMTEGNPAYMKNKGGLMLQSGGAVPMNNMSKQMELFEPVTRGFETGGLMDEGGTVDPVSGNDVPPGSTQEEVRDDIPAQLSEGEFVFPADVVRFIGLEKLMMIRQRAKAGLQRMEDMGQMGNSEEAIMPDTLPFSIEDLDMEDDGLEMAQGGVVQAANGTFVQPTPTTPNSGVYYNPAGSSTTGVATAPVQAASASRSQPVQTNVPVVDVNAPKETFENYIGQNIPGVNFKYVTYIDENGNKIQLRQSLTSDEMLDPVPEGYKLFDAEKAKVDTATSQTTRVQSTTDDGDGGDNQEDDGLGPGGARVGWGGQKDISKRGGPFGGLKTGSTQVGISYFNTGTLGAAGALSFVGGRLTGKDVPAGVDVGMTVGGVTTKISAADYNKAKAAGYMGTFSDGLLEKAQTNVATAGQLSSKYGLNKTQGTFEDFVNDAVESKLGIEELAKDYNIDLDEVKSGFLGLGKDYDDVVDKAVKEANKGYTGDDPFTADDIKSGHAARTTIDAQNAAVNAKAAAQRAADKAAGNDGRNVNDGGYNDVGFDDGGGGRDDAGAGQGAGTSSGNQGGGYGGGTDCLTEDMKVNLNGVIDFVTNIKVGDMIDNYKVKEVLHKHMRSGYYAINNELKISNDHPVLANGTWTRPEDLEVGDNINGIPVLSLEYVERMTPTVSIVIDGESFDVHTENNIYTVHGRYREVRQEAA